MRGVGQMGNPCRWRIRNVIVEQHVESIFDGLASLIRDAGLRERWAQGGYPRGLLDDDAEVDAPLELMSRDKQANEDCSFRQH